MSTSLEFQRLQALHRYQILDTEFEKEFDNLVKLASHICHTPMSLISFVAEDRQWFKAKLGVEARETPREFSLCDHTIRQQQLMEVKDASLDKRFCDNPLVKGTPAIRFYAGMPLTTPDGFNLGTLCVIDQKPRELSMEQKIALETLATQVVTQLELRVKLQLLHKEKQKIAEKNRAVTESIRYAKRIQNAMLPREKKVQLYFDDFFVINQPRDIIGGDFYWMAEINQKKILVVADCTGHGVPGALMSMLGNALLRDIIYKTQVTTPEEILTLLDIEVTKILHQHDCDNEDGMDMSIVCIDEECHSLTFAGANHKMVYFHDNDAYLVTGDQRCIGGKAGQKDLPQFSSYTVGYCTRQTPVFYLFSDGFKDQFGGERRRKFTLKKLMEELYVIHQQPGIQQQQTLQDTLRRWMNTNNERQTDDIIFIGFRPKVGYQKRVTNTQGQSIKLA